MLCFYIFSFLTLHVLIDVWVQCVVVLSVDVCLVSDVSWYIC